MRRALTFRLMSNLVGGLLALIGLGVAHAEDRPINPYFELGPVVVHGDEADALMLGLGAFDMFDDETSAAATLEYRLGRKLFAIGPALGGMANADGGLYGYFGLYGDLSIGKVYFTPQLAARRLTMRAAAEIWAASSSSARRPSSRIGSTTATASGSGSRTSRMPASTTSTRARRSSI